MDIKTLQRFFDKVQFSNVSGGCWIWTAYRNPCGYGQFRHDGRMPLAHRVAQQIHFGPIPNGMQALHKCDVPACVCPHHLFLGTQTENIADMMKKGRKRTAPPERNGSAKLNWEAVRAIRKDTRFQREIAATYGIDRTTVSRIKLGQDWKE